MKLRALPIRLMGRKRMRSTILTASLSGLIFLYSAASWGAIAIKAEPVVTGLSSPVDITHAGDGSGRLFIILQGGRIVIFDGVQILSPPYLDITSLVSSGGERGLLGAVFHPNYGGNGFFYVSYTDSAGDSVIARYSVSLDPNRADSTSGVILLTIPQPFSNHNGGQLHFGPDGYLYIGIGDGGSGGDPQNNGQDLGTLLGKIIRIDVDSGLPFTVPPDNPFVGIVGAREEIWSYGLRNPWRFSFDRLTGDMFIGDVGQGS
jgi:glucose/arabinose dehydrogenase